jgi:hypothetical protein
MVDSQFIAVLVTLVVDLAIAVLIMMGFLGWRKYRKDEVRDAAEGEDDHSYDMFN